MSFTSTSTTDTLSTSLVSPSMSRDVNRGHNQLRRRMHILANPILNTALPPAVSKDIQDQPSRDHSGVDDHYNEDLEHPVATGSVSESESNTSEEPLIGVLDGAEAHGNASLKHERNLHRISPLHYTSYSSNSMSPTSRSWYEFDLSVVVALVSPIGNWLTGGDHVKHLLLILLLVFYLHQMIEIPWALYHNSRPRRRPRPHEGHLDPNSHIAASELRTLEIFFLILTVASPLLGALFLRYVIAVVSGKDSLSWFSTALFVLATGIRPWRHLVDRFNQRTKELHDAIHYPPVSDITDSKIDEMTARLNKLEISFASLRTKLANTTEELFEYVDEAVDSVEITGRKHERKHEKQELRLKEVEDTVAALKKTKEMEKKLSVKTNIDPSMALMSLLPSWLGLGLLSPPRTPTRMRHAPPSAVSKHGLRTFPSNSSIRLESIPEEDTKPPPASTASSFQLHIPGARLVLRWGDLATLPLRRVVHYLLT